MDYPDLTNLRMHLYELGSILSDTIAYKKLLVQAASTFNNEKAYRKAMESYRSALLPEIGDGSDEISRMADLMKELENTIVLIDKKSFNK